MNKSKIAVLSALSALSCFASDPVMPDITTTVTATTAIAVGAATLGVSILLFRLGRKFLSKLA